MPDKNRLPENPQEALEVIKRDRESTGVMNRVHAILFLALFARIEALEFNAAEAAKGEVMLDEVTAAPAVDCGTFTDSVSAAITGSAEVAAEASPADTPVTVVEMSVPRFKSYLQKSAPSGNTRIA